MHVIDFIGTVVLTAVITVNVNAVINTLQVSRPMRLGLAAGAGLWIGLQAALASAGAFATAVPYIGISVAFPLVAAAVALYAAPAFRAAMLAVPTPLLVGLNISRVLGAFFLILAASGRLGGPFPQSAGWGDIIVGVLALPLAFAIARGTASRGAVLLWNTLGTVDLIAAVGLGVVSAEGSPIQMIHAGAGSVAISALPWAFIPTVLVPFYLIMHGVIFLQMQERRRGGMELAAAV